jgi:DNA-binding MarR family transcriptional regulator
MAEQFAGKVQTFIIDKEGEFPSLREKFDYALVGNGGETPTDPQTAELVCQKLLETNLSCIFDLYALKDPERHLWVKNFLDALMNAPKNLWHPVIIMVDEAHRFCPERGMGESEAYGPMIDLATDGRKRGFCALFATQRLGKLSKNASAELLNRFIGRTLEDIDVDRAADLMSVRRQEKPEFELGLKTMKPGRFWAFGQAVCIERKLLHVGPVLTTHPEPGTAAAGMVPPTPAMVKKLLPQLADLPRQAESKIKTEAELRQELLNVKARLAVAEKKLLEKQVTVTVEKPVEKIVEVPAVDAKTIKAVHQVVWNIERAAEKVGKIVEFEAELKNWAGTLSKELNAAIDAQDNVRKAPPMIQDQGRIARTPVPANGDAEQAPSEKMSDGEVLSRPQITILRGIREFNSIDIDHVSRHQLAGWLGKKVSGSFLNDISRLKALGLIEYYTTQTDERTVFLTTEGLKYAPPLQWEVSPDGVFSQVLSAVTGPQQEILKACRNVFPKWISREEVAVKLEKTVSGSFLNDLSKLHTAVMIEYGNNEWKQHVRLAAWTILASAVTV